MRDYEAISREFLTDPAGTTIRHRIVEREIISGLLGLLESARSEDKSVEYARHYAKMSVLVSRAETAADRAEKAASSAVTAAQSVVDRTPAKRTWRWGL